MNTALPMFQNQEWINEAMQAIAKVDPAAPTVLQAIRGYELFGRQAPIRARLQDGSQWLIEDGKAKKLSDVEIADFLHSAQSFE